MDRAVQGQACRAGRYEPYCPAGYHGLTTRRWDLEDCPPARRPDHDGAANRFGSPAVDHLYAFRMRRIGRPEGTSIAGSSRIQPVTDPADRLQMLRLAGVLLEGLAQPAD